MTEESLIDVFMPNDLCARCDDEEPVVKHSVTVRRGSEVARLSFCSMECRWAFLSGMEAVQRTELE